MEKIKEILRKAKGLLRKLKRIILDNKGMSIAVGAVIVLALVALILNVAKTTKDEKDATKKEESLSAITAEGIIKEEEYNGLKFTNISLIKENKIYTMSLDVTNTTEQAIEVEQVNIPIKDADNNTLITLLGYIGDPLKPKETRTITAGTSADLSKAFTKEITESK